MDLIVLKLPGEHRPEHDAFVRPRAPGRPNVPGGQLLQSLTLVAAAALEYVASGQAWQPSCSELAPRFFPYLPAAHEMHDPCPDEL